MIHSDTLTLKLVMPGGLVFGKGPGDPAMPPVPSDMFEEFLVGATPVPLPLLTMPGLSPATSAAIFDTFDAAPIASPLAFVMGGPPPADPILIPLGPAGLSLLAGAAGGDVVLTGWMPTWSEDLRIAPGSMPPAFFEGSELIFGFTDVHAGFAKPLLTIEFTPVPEAGAGLLFGVVAISAGAVSWLRRQRPSPPRMGASSFGPKNILVIYCDLG